jgi:hypothetical protein
MTVFAVADLRQIAHPPRTTACHGGCTTRREPRRHWVIRPRPAPAWHAASEESGQLVGQALDVVRGAAGLYPLMQAAGQDADVRRQVSDPSASALNSAAMMFTP